ncbi:MAG: HD-GYP domain-containing protein [Negativicutes bacterium]
MRIVSLNELKPEMELAREIMDPDNGRVLLNVGAVGLLQYAERLRGIGINYLYVREALSADITIPATVKDALRYSAEKALDTVYEKCEVGQQPDFLLVKNAVKEIIQDVLSNPDILINVYEMRCCGGDFISHSVNVAFLSLLVGRHLGYDADKMKKLGMGALLHDVGVAGMPKTILEKRGGFSLEEKLIYEQHSVIGYHRVKDSWEISSLSRGIILCHHERSDGSGYPRQLLKGDIHEFSRIVGLVDCFEELAGGHPFAQNMNIHNALEVLLVKADEWFAPDVVNSFISNIPICQVGTTVKLSDGSMAVVVAQNKGFPTRPVVRIIEDRIGKRVTMRQEVDLLKNNHLVLQSSWDVSGS